MANRREKNPGDLRLEHQEASREHAAWRRDVERWRRSYQEALIACARRLASELQLDNFETALDRHEAAIDAHEEAIRRHETTLGLGQSGEIGLSEGPLDFHRVMRFRHRLSKGTHEQLERSHRAILEALELLGRR